MSLMLSYNLFTLFLMKFWSTSDVYFRIYIQVIRCAIDQQRFLVLVQGHIYHDILMRNGQIEPFVAIDSFPQSGIYGSLVAQIHLNHHRTILDGRRNMMKFLILLSAGVK